MQPPFPLHTILRVKWVADACNSFFNNKWKILGSQKHSSRLRPHLQLQLWLKHVLLTDEGEKAATEESLAHPTFMLQPVARRNISQADWYL